MKKRVLALVLCVLLILSLSTTALGFNVGWTLERGMFLEPGVPYDFSN